MDPSALSKAISEYARAIREAKGVSQGRWAELLAEQGAEKVSQQTVSKVENGESITLDNLVYWMKLDGRDRVVILADIATRWRHTEETTGAAPATAALPVDYQLGQGAPPVSGGAAQPPQLPQPKRKAGHRRSIAKPPGEQPEHAPKKR